MIQKEPRPTINPGARLPIVTKEPTATTPLTYLHLPPYALVQQSIGYGQAIRCLRLVALIGLPDREIGWLPISMAPVLLSPML